VSCLASAAGEPPRVSLHTRPLRHGTGPCRRRWSAPLLLAMRVALGSVDAVSGMPRACLLPLPANESCRAAAYLGVAHELGAVLGHRAALVQHFPRAGWVRRQPYESWEAAIAGAQRLIKLRTVLGPQRLALGGAASAHGASSTGVDFDHGAQPPRAVGGVPPRASALLERLDQRSITSTVAGGGLRR